MIGEAAGELEHSIGRDVVGGEAFLALPTDFDPGKQVGFRARELEQARRLELTVTEDLGVGHEGTARAAPVGRRADRLYGAERLSARKFLRVELLVTRDFDAGVGG